MKSRYISLLFLITLLRIASVSAQNNSSGNAPDNPFADEKNKLWQPYRITPRSGTQHVSLSGDGWELSHTDAPITDLKAPRKDAFQTSIPNSVHWSYFKAGKLPHPYYHKNSDQYKFMDEKAWYYRKTFSTPARAKSGSYVFLCFDGVDYFSKVWLNGTLVGVHEGMFGGPTVDIGKLLKASGQNELLVEVRAGNWGNKATDYESLPRNSNGEYMIETRKGYNPRASGRIIKPWVISGSSGCEMFFSVGMWQDVRLEIVQPYHLERPYLTTTSIQNGKATLHFSSEVLVDTNSLGYQLHPWKNAQMHHYDGRVPGTTLSNANLSVVVELVDKAGKVAFTQEKPFKAFKGRTWFDDELTVTNPKLWHPNGLGEANLYTVRVVLKKDHQVVDQIQFPFGIRTIERIASAGPRTADRWKNWQFVVNGRKFFVKGMNFTPQDVLLETSKERYRWTLEAAKKMGVQLIRIWGGGLLETEHFYEICNELGIMVWQDFPIGNQDTPLYPQDIWEAQVVQTIVRLRNHPSLAVWCGGNEFNPYSYGNAATMGILERNLDIFDKSRLYVRTTPDDGSLHTYPDMDPTWYGVGYRYEPWISETGMHSMPEANMFYETVDNKEFTGLGRMWDKEFYKDHPEFIHHFTEYGPSRVPRMLSRASHIADMNDPTIEAITEASQVGAGEFYQVFSEKMQGNYPVTTGLLPWVFKRHWPVIAIQMMDWFGNAGAPYYFLKRTYEPTHVAVDIPRLLWKAGERIKLPVNVMHSLPQAIPGAKISVQVFDDTFKPLWKQEQKVAVAAGTSVRSANLGEYTIPADYRDRYLLLVAELHDGSGKLLSRSFYYPRSLSMLDDQAFYQKYTSDPIPWPTLEKGPFLKPTVAKTTTSLTTSVVSQKPTGTDQSQLRVKVTNTGKVPAFMARVDITGTKRAIVASDNFTWIAPGETQEIDLDVIWREPSTRPNAKITVSAWNATPTTAKIP
ncbi:MULTISPECIES: sugar-binding domain-containing protein [unclassified Spirosoma]|uniref:glycoside hydrolase family 2 protein n=1 Tax=unclassified Spirosoma TaxID=2621999 RepID=UPI00095DF1A4|nr:MULTISPECIES: sugar-binding domain-containing protein [unclassified Spirosoma]MBN8825718.1 beta-mannosidase [Spirosoma sp.]OJW76589.1 MAG: beta-mannosidase [Spirosoma sp. 48-14]